VPHDIIFLKGLFINQIKFDANTGCHGFIISHNSDLFRTRIFYHKSQEVIDEWMRALKLQTTGV
jgi:hypothetical protein